MRWTRLVRRVDKLAAMRNVKTIATIGEAKLRFGVPEWSGTTKARIVIDGHTFDEQVLCCRKQFVACAYYAAGPLESEVAVLLGRPGWESRNDVVLARLFAACVDVRHAAYPGAPVPSSRS